MLQILLDLWWIFFFFFSFRQLKLEFAQLELTQDFVMSELQSKKSWKVMKLNWREKRTRYTKTYFLLWFMKFEEIIYCFKAAPFQINGFKAFLSLIIFLISISRDIFHSSPEKKRQKTNRKYLMNINCFLCNLYILFSSSVLIWQHCNLSKVHSQ